VVTTSIWQLNAQLARHDPHRVDVAAVRGGDDHLPQAARADALADLGPHPLRGLGRVCDVPGERMCSFDLPTACTGRNSTDRSAGRRAITLSTMPCPMIVSVETARCGPAVSIAAIGSDRDRLFSGSSAANSSVVSFEPMGPCASQTPHRGAYFRP
jgi:hypothetical protein